MAENPTPSSSAAKPKLPWMTRLSAAAYTSAVNAACRPDGTVNRFFMNLVDSKVSPSAKPLCGVSTTDVTVDPSRNLWFRLFLPSSDAHPPSAAGHPVIFFFHGGGFCFFAPNSKPFDQLCRTMARTLPAIVVSVNYRLTPEHRYPAQYEDGFDVLKFIDSVDHFPESGDPSRCFLAGDSAGGNVAHNVALRAAADGDDGKKQLQRLTVKGLIAIQPFFGGKEITESETRLAEAPLSSTERANWMWKVFLPEGSERDHPACDVFGERGEDVSRLPRFPATLVIVGGFDALQDWQRRYYQGLKRSGKEAKLVEYPNCTHGFYIFPELPEASMIVAEIKDFVQTH